MGCVESNLRVKKIRVVQQAAEDARRSSRQLNSGNRPPRTPLPNLVDDEYEEELRGLSGSELGESREFRRGDLRVAGSSPDSGVFELSDPEYAGVVTERSPEQLKQQVERDFRSPDPGIDLMITGHACPRRTVTSMRSEEAAILQSLRQEGLLTMERAATTGGLSYELVISGEEAGREGAWLIPGARLPPIKLEKLERRRARHRRSEQLSEEQIIARLERAEERRREAEMEKVRRLTERTGSARPEVHHLQQLARLRRNVEKFENTLENREQHIQSLREKLRQHHEHAAVIRLKRSLATSEGDASRADTPAAADAL